jgi:L-alanine-DL-glutamate epimerase-like enolase superfamily enzyme
MTHTRRKFFRNSALLSLGVTFSLNGCRAGNKERTFHDLDKIMMAKVIDKNLYPNPLIIDSVELLRYENNFICRVRTKDGAVGISVSNNMQMVSLYPIFVNRIQPFFIGKDARDIESLLDEVYVFQSNYKLQSLALWIPVATIEFAILDLLGRATGKSIGEVIGKINQTEISVYRANNFRGRPAEESIELIQRNVESSNARALKFKIGGRMSGNKDNPPGRTEALIPLVRKTFGEEMTIYADSNGSYTVDEAIRIGKILEDHAIDFYEEPVPFDWYLETKEVADSLTIPIAGGEQEGSLHQFKWLIEKDALQIVQPDIFYFGGMIRSTRVARMAASLGKECTPHISGSGLGYLYMMHFVSTLEMPGPFHEFKGFNTQIPFDCPTSELSSTNGVVKVPGGPGSGINIDPDFIARHKIVL